jgi:hypothetical protein
MRRVLFVILATLAMFNQSAALADPLSRPVLDQSVIAAPGLPESADPSERSCSGSKNDDDLDYCRSISAVDAMPPRPVMLFTISDEPSVEVVRLATHPPANCSKSNGACVLFADAFVTIPSQLVSFCSQESNPILSFEKALGLKPDTASHWSLYTFSVRSSDLSRPCAGKWTLHSASCTVPDPTELAAFRERLNSKFYPFTAMGWTYNWSKKSKDHVGVSEFLVKAGAIISGEVKEVSFDAFCSEASAQSTALSR